MKIVCSKCKTVLGEQKPYKDLTEISALCNACVSKEKEEALKAKPMPEPGDNREVTFENGSKGILSVVGKETEDLSFFDLLVSEKKFFCAKETRQELISYLKEIADDEVDVTFLHSSNIKLDKPLRGRRKKKDHASEEKKKPESIHYNCTIRVPKQFVSPMFDDKAERFKQVAEILTEAAMRNEKEERQKTQSSEALSDNSNQTSRNSLHDKELGKIKTK